MTGQRKARKNLRKKQVQTGRGLQLRKKRKVIGGGTLERQKKCTESQLK